MPSGVTSITVDMAGASGGTYSAGGGKGGRVQTTIAVTAGTILFINVGQAGVCTTSRTTTFGAPYYVKKIMAKYAGQGKRASLSCAAELIRAGYKDNARW